LFVLLRTMLVPVGVTVNVPRETPHVGMHRPVGQQQHVTHEIQVQAVTDKMPAVFGVPVDRLVIVIASDQYLSAG
jgi:hypothetical protein